jgi:hypothetical protein
MAASAKGYRGREAAQHGTKSRRVICSSMFRCLFTYFLFRQCICDKMWCVVGRARIGDVGIGRHFAFLDKRMR